jgi:hypothetical protein
MVTKGLQRRGANGNAGAPNALKLEPNSRRDGGIPQVEGVNWGIDLEQDRKANNGEDGKITMFGGGNGELSVRTNRA